MYQVSFLHHALAILSINHFHGGGGSTGVLMFEDCPLAFDVPPGRQPPFRM
jgi:hypothetical protein